MSSKFKPVSRRLLCAMPGKATDLILPSGLIAPESAKSVTEVLDIVAVSGDIEYCKAGDRALVLKNGGAEIIVDGIRRILLDERVLLGVFCNDTAAPTEGVL